MQRHSSLACRATRGGVLCAASFMTVALLCGSALADSSVYLTNNTSKPIKALRKDRRSLLVAAHTPLAAHELGPPTIRPFVRTDDYR
ncbi:MAG: hypothetical protein JKY37_31605 [Nannocystaceae bacterium]|nr:hypothetical protein [Nannocystaceae bacterium]